MTKLLLGINPLTGVDHLSHERAREKNNLMNLTKRLRIFKAAFAAGCEGFNFSLGDSIATEILAELRNNQFESNIELYPMFPDTQSSLKSIAEGGISGAIMEVLGNLSWSGRAIALFRGGVSYFSSDPLGLALMFLDSEVEKLSKIMPAGAKLSTILLNELVTDSCVSFNCSRVFEIYVDHLRRRYGLKAGFVTRNLPRFLHVIGHCNFKHGDIIVMTPMNKIGFQMVPSRIECEEAIRTMDKIELIGMSVMAAGQITPKESVEYLKTFHMLRAVVVGTSDESHATETFTLLRDALRTQHPE